MHMHYSDGLPFFDYDGTELGALESHSGREVLVNGEVEAFDIGQFSFFTVLRNKGCHIHVVPTDSCFGIPWKSKALIRAALRCLGVPFTVAKSEDLLDALRKSRPNDIWVSARYRSNGWYAQSTVISALPKPTKEDEKVLEELTKTEETAETAEETPAQPPTPDTAEIRDTVAYLTNAVGAAQCRDTAAYLINEVGAAPCMETEVPPDTSRRPGEEFLSRREDGIVALERVNGRYIFKPGDIPDNSHNRTRTSILHHYLEPLLRPNQEWSIQEKETHQSIVTEKLSEAFNDYFVWDAAHPELRAVMVAYAAEAYRVEGSARGLALLAPFTLREERFINNLREFVRISGENQTYETP